VNYDDAVKAWGALVLDVPADQIDDVLVDMEMDPGCPTCGGGSATVEVTIFLTRPLDHSLRTDYHPHAMPEVATSPSRRSVTISYREPVDLLREVLAAVDGEGTGFADRIAIEPELKKRYYAQLAERREAERQRQADEREARIAAGNKILGITPH
jgi:hypothetical protein